VQQTFAVRPEQLLAEVRWQRARAALRQGQRVWFPALAAIRDAAAVHSALWPYLAAWPGLPSKHLQAWRCARGQSLALHRLHPDARHGWILHSGRCLSPAKLRGLCPLQSLQVNWNAFSSR
jgi:hypothetical protein